MNCIHHRPLGIATLLIDTVPATAPVGTPGKRKLPGITDTGVLNPDQLMPTSATFSCGGALAGKDQEALHEMVPVVEAKTNKYWHDRMLHTANDEVVPLAL